MILCGHYAPIHFSQDIINYATSQLLAPIIFSDHSGTHSDINQYERQQDTTSGSSLTFILLNSNECGLIIMFQSNISQIFTAICSAVHESRLTDLTRDTWTPRLRCMPAHRIQRKTPRFHDAHLGPVRNMHSISLLGKTCQL